MSAEALDSIRIGGLRGYGYHGVLPGEREVGQEFVVDVVLSVDTRRAAATDDLADTVDYGDLADRIHRHITGPPLALLEALAERIARDCLNDPAIHAVEVTVHKPQAPVSLPFRDISVRITRRR